MEPIVIPKILEVSHLPIESEEPIKKKTHQFRISAFFRNLFTGPKEIQEVVTITANERKKENFPTGYRLNKEILLRNPDFFLQDTQYSIPLIIAFVIVIISVVGIIGFLVLLFIGGTSSIFTSIDYAPNVTNVFSFLFETNGWATEHHITNFGFTLFFSSFFLYFIEAMGKKRSTQITGFSFETIFKISMYIATIALNLVYSIIGEIIERIVSLVVRVIFWNNEAGYVAFMGYASETSNDIILSDVLQGLIVPIEVVLFIAFVIKTTSCLLFYKRWYWIIFRVLVYIALFSPSGFISTVDKTFYGRTLHVGFFIQICIKIILVVVLFVEDILHYRILYWSKIKTPISNSLDVILVYLFFLTYLFIQWILTVHLTTWGLIFSNGFAVIYLCTFIAVKKTYSFLRY